MENTQSPTVSRRAQALDALKRHAESMADRGRTATMQPRQYNPDSQLRKAHVYNRDEYSHGRNPSDGGFARKIEGILRRAMKRSTRSNTRSRPGIARMQTNTNFRSPSSKSSHINNNDKTFSDNDSVSSETSENSTSSVQKHDTQQDDETQPSSSYLAALASTEKTIPLRTVPNRPIRPSHGRALSSIMEEDSNTSVSADASEEKKDVSNARRWYQAANAKHQLNGTNNSSTLAQQLNALKAKRTINPSVGNSSSTGTRIPTPSSDSTKRDSTNDIARDAPRLRAWATRSRRISGGDTNTPNRLGGGAINKPSSITATDSDSVLNSQEGTRLSEDNSSLQAKGNSSVEDANTNSQEGQPANLHRRNTDSNEGIHVVSTPMSAETPQLSKGKSRTSIQSTNGQSNSIFNSQSGVSKVSNRQTPTGRMITADMIHKVSTDVKSLHTDVTELQDENIWLQQRVGQLRSSLEYRLNRLYEAPEQIEQAVHYWQTEYESRELEQRENDWIDEFERDIKRQASTIIYADRHKFETDLVELHHRVQSLESDSVISLLKTFLWMMLAFLIDGFNVIVARVRIFFEPIFVAIMASFITIRHKCDRCRCCRRTLSDTMTHDSLTQESHQSSRNSHRSQDDYYEDKHTRHRRRKDKRHHSRRHRRYSFSSMSDLNDDNSRKEHRRNRNIRQNDSRDIRHGQYRSSSNADRDEIGSDYSERSVYSDLNGSTDSSTTTSGSFSGEDNYRHASRYSGDIRRHKRHKQPNMKQKDPYYGKHRRGRSKRLGLRNNGDTISSRGYDEKMYVRDAHPIPRSSVGSEDSKYSRHDSFVMRRYGPAIVQSDDDISQPKDSSGFHLRRRTTMRNPGIFSNSQEVSNSRIQHKRRSSDGLDFATDRISHKRRSSGGLDYAADHISHKRRSFDGPEYASERADSMQRHRQRRRTKSSDETSSESGETSESSVFEYVDDSRDIRPRQYVSPPRSREKHYRREIARPSSGDIVRSKHDPIQALQVQEHHSRSASPRNVRHGLIDDRVSEKPFSVPVENIRQGLHRRNISAVSRPQLSIQTLESGEGQTWASSREDKPSTAPAPTTSAAGRRYAMLAARSRYPRDMDDSTRSMLSARSSNMPPNKTSFPQNTNPGTPVSSTR